jgi:hypothetical protein
LLIVIRRLLLAILESPCPGGDQTVPDSSLRMKAVRIIDGSRRVAALPPGQEYLASAVRRTPVLRAAMAGRWGGGSLPQRDHMEERQLLEDQSAFYTLVRLVSSHQVDTVVGREGLRSLHGKKEPWRSRWGVIARWRL